MFWEVFKQIWKVWMGINGLGKPLKQLFSRYSVESYRRMQESYGSMIPGSPSVQARRNIQKRNVLTG